MIRCESIACGMTELQRADGISQRAQAQKENHIMETCKNLAALANEARMLALDVVHTAKSGHVGGSFSVIDALTVLYFNTMRIDPADSKNPDRDRFVLSKGLCSPALYAVLALRGYFPKEELKTFILLLNPFAPHLTEEMWELLG